MLFRTKKKSKSLSEDIGCLGDCDNCQNIELCGAEKARENSLIDFSHDVGDSYQSCIFLERFWED